jgi:hypothetical protein
MKKITALLVAFSFWFIASAIVTHNTTASINFAILFTVGSVIVANGYSRLQRSGMAMSCGDVDQDLALDCDAPLQAGVRATLFICNKEDISTETYGTNKMLLTDLVMKTGKQFFTIEGVKQSTKPTVEMVKGTLINKWKHTVKFLGLSIDVAFNDQIRRFADGNYVAIIKNFETGVAGENTYDVYGIGAGIMGEAITRDPFNKDTSGGWEITLASQETTLESKPPVRLFKTSSATTETLIGTLTAPAA